MMSGPDAHRTALVLACAAASWPEPWWGVLAGAAFVLLLVLAGRWLS